MKLDCYNKILIETTYPKTAEAIRPLKLVSPEEFNRLQTRK